MTFIQIKNEKYPVTKITPNYIEYFKKGLFENDTRVWYDWKISPAVKCDCAKIMILNENETK